MARDIAEVPAVEVIVTVAVNLMSAAAVKLGLTDEGDKYKDLDEARKLVTALAGLLDASATEISSFHAAPLRDGLKSSSSPSARRPSSATSRARPGREVHGPRLRLAARSLRSPRTCEQGLARRRRPGRQYRQVEAVHQAGPQRLVGG